VDLATLDGERIGGDPAVVSPDTTGVRRAVTAMTQQQTGLKARKRGGARQYLVLACAVACVLAAAGAVSYYGEEIRLYLSLGGWNSGTATRVTDQFVRRLQSGQILNALALVDPSSYQPYKENDQVVGLEHNDESGRGRYHVLFKELIPPGHVELGKVQLTSSDRGGFIVPVRFGDRTEGWFVVGRTQNGYRIVSLPTVPGRFHY
jgi:hypothetical protein